MKKVLLATTALTLSAGIAAAEVKISGSAEMGVIGGDSIETQFHNDIDVTFKMSGETDNGIAFSAAVDLDEAGNLGRSNDNQGVAISISGAFGKLTLGDTVEAFSSSISYMGVGNPGSIVDNETGHAGFNDEFGGGSFDDQVLKYEYSMGALGIAASYEQGATNASTGELVATDPDGSMAIGATYSMDAGGIATTFGVGYHTSNFGTADDETLVGVGASIDMGNGLVVGVQFASASNLGGVSDVDGTHTGIGVGYTMDAISLHANYGVYDVDGDGGDDSGLGLAAAYDLGGGAAVKLGYGSSEIDGGEDDTNWSLGVTMKF